MSADWHTYTFGKSDNRLYTQCKLRYLCITETGYFCSIYLVLEQMISWVVADYLQCNNRLFGSVIGITDHTTKLIQWVCQIKLFHFQPPIYKIIESMFQYCRNNINTSVAPYIPIINTVFWIQLTSLHFVSLGNEWRVYCGLLFPHIQHLLWFFSNNIYWSKHHMKVTTKKLMKNWQEKPIKKI